MKKKNSFLDSAPVFFNMNIMGLWNSGKFFQFLHKGKNCN